MLKIAVTMRVAEAPGYAERRDCLAQDWARWLAARGILPLPVPNGLPDPVAFLRETGAAGLIISGGNTVGLEGETHPPADVKPERDRTERALLDHAVAVGLPVLGVCRGLQMVNRHFGGTVTRGIAAAVGSGHVGCEHAVRWRADGRLLRVNSYHDDGVLAADLASALEVLGESDDGRVIEALRHPTLPILAVQWHPERPGPSGGFDDRMLADHFRRED